MHRRSIPVSIALGLSGIALAACSGSASISIGGQSPTDAARELIEGEISDQAGLELTDVECESPDDTDVGTTFACTAESDEGTVHFIAEIDREDHLNVDSTNVLRADVVDEFEASAAAELSATVGAELPVENFDCGDEVVVLDDSMTLECELTDPASGDTYDATVTITDLDRGAFDVEVSDSPN